MYIIPADGYTAYTQNQEELILSIREVGRVSDGVGREDIYLPLGHLLMGLQAYY